MTAKDSGMHIYGMTVMIQKECLLKAARAFLVFREVEAFGEILVYRPSSQDIEDEKFDMNFSLVYFTKESPEKIKAAIENVSEVKEAIVGEFKLPESGADKSEEKTSQEEEKKKEKPAKQASATAVKNEPKKEAAKKSEKKNVKPAVGRTVRVDIEKLDVLMNLVSELIIAKNSLVSASSV